ncbi:MAG TPA: DUF948 domain-containing protein [Armatimonadota bacterium]|nr:DUF948 domain-containing protein [Armatimonadota bacterium]
MAALTVTSIIAITVIGLLVIAELVALTLLFSRISGLAQQIRNRIDPVVTESTHLLHTANDVASTVKDNTQKVTGKVADVTDNIASRVDNTSLTVQRVATATLEQLSSPPIITALAIFAGFRVISSLQRVLSWPFVTAIALIAGLPFGIRLLRSFRQRRGEMPQGRAHLVLRPQAEEEETIIRRAA